MSKKPLHIIDWFLSLFYTLHFNAYQMMCMPFAFTLILLPKSNLYLLSFRVFCLHFKYFCICIVFMHSCTYFLLCFYLFLYSFLLLFTGFAISVSFHYFGFFKIFFFIILTLKYKYLNKLSEKNVIRKFY